MRLGAFARRLSESIPAAIKKPFHTVARDSRLEGYGCEPVFALAYSRHVNDNGRDLKLTYASPRFDEALRKLGLGVEKRQEIFEQVMSEGTCQHIQEIPQAVRDTFVVSGDITAEEYVRMQASLQAFVDNSLSKTVNFPEIATEQDVATAYMRAWELGCKGITVYVTGSRDKVVLETKATAEKKEAPVPAIEAQPQKKPELSPRIYHDAKKPRPRALTGKTYNFEMPVGKAFITINENGGGPSQRLGAGARGYVRGAPRTRMAGRERRRRRGPAPAPARRDRTKA